MHIAYNDYCGEPVGVSKKEYMVEMPYLLDTGDKPFREAVEQGISKILCVNHSCGKYHGEPVKCLSKAGTPCKNLAPGGLCNFTGDCNYKSKETPTRSEAHLDAADCLELDNDNEHSDNPSDWITHEALMGEGGLFCECDAWVQESRNSGKVKHPDDPEKCKSARPREHYGFRLDKPCVAEEIKAIKRALCYSNEATETRRPETMWMDKMALDAPRLVFGVSRNLNHEVSVHCGGKGLDTVLIEKGWLCLNTKSYQVEAVQSTKSNAQSTLPATTKKKSVASTPSTDKAPATGYREYTNGEVEKVLFPCVKKALESAPLSYTDWCYKIGMALHAGGYPFELFNEISKKLPGYKSESDCFNHWNSFSSNKVDGITFASFVELAKQGGFNEFDKFHAMDLDTNEPLFKIEYKDPLTLTESINPLAKTNFPPFPPLSEMTEGGTAKLIKRWWQGWVIYVNEIGFMIFDPRDGFKDSYVDPVTHELTKGSIVHFTITKLLKLQKVWMDNNALNDGYARKKMEQYYRNLQSTSFQQGVEKQLQACCNIAALALDKYSHLINCDGLVYDLSGAQPPRPMTPQDLITKSTGCRPTTENKELLIKFLRSLFPKEGGEEVLKFLLARLGATMAVKDPNPCVHYCTGSKEVQLNGSNGKSSFFALALKAFGSYGNTLPATILMKNKNEGAARWVTIKLWGLRLAVCEEAPDGVLDDNAIKSVADRHDLTGEKKGKDPLTFHPTHQVFFTTNHELSVFAQDYGTWRRLLRIPFEARFDKDNHKNNAFVSEVHKKCAGALLALIIGYAEKAIRNDFEIPAPEVIKLAVNTYRNEQNLMKMFMDEYSLEPCEYDVDSEGKPTNSEQRLLWSNPEYWNLAPELRSRDSMGVVQMYEDFNGGRRLKPNDAKRFVNAMRSECPHLYIEHSHELRYAYGIRKKSDEESTTTITPAKSPKEIVLQTRLKG